MNSFILGREEEVPEGYELRELHLRVKGESEDIPLRIAIYLEGQKDSPEQPRYQFKDFDEICNLQIEKTFWQPIEQKFDGHILWIPDNRHLTFSDQQSGYVQKFTGEGKTLDEAVFDLSQKVSLYVEQGRKLFYEKYPPEASPMLMVREKPHIESFGRRESNPYVIIFRFSMLSASLDTVY